MLHVGSAPVDPEKVHLAILEEFLNCLILCGSSLRWILLPSAPLAGVIYRKKDTLILYICRPVFVLWQACWMVMAIQKKHENFETGRSDAEEGWPIGFAGALLYADWLTSSSLYGQRLLHCIWCRSYNLVVCATAGCAFPLVKLFLVSKAMACWSHPFPTWSSRVIDWKLSWPISCTSLLYGKCMQQTVK